MTVQARRLAAWVCGLGLMTGVAGQRAWAGQFDRMGHEAIVHAFNNPHQTARLARVSLRDSRTRFQNILPGSPGACVLVRTNQGNWAKVLFQFQGQAMGHGSPPPSLMISRYVVYRPNGHRLRMGANVRISSSYTFDLDSGMPAAPGADLWFHNVDNRPTTIFLEAQNGAQMAVVQRPLAGGPGGAHPGPGGPGGPGGQPGPGGVAAGPFSGSFRMTHDGRWTGTLVLRVNAHGQILPGSRYHSDQHGRDYRVTGSAGQPTSNKIVFHIQFPTHTQRFEGYLATWRHGSIAGVTHWNGRPFGFYAIRR